MKQPAICGVYAIVASDGREYIGSSRDVVTRVIGHRYALEGGRSPHRLLQRAWSDLGGGDAFTVQIIEEVADPANLAAAEQRHFDLRAPALNVPAQAGRPGSKTARSTEISRLIVEGKNYSDAGSTSGLPKQHDRCAAVLDPRVRRPRRRVVA